MALTGKPSVVEPRAAREPDPSPSLRPTQQAIVAIRERLRLIEAEVNQLAAQATAIAESTVDATDLASLQASVGALITRVALLEAESPTEWYVNGALIGTRHRVNFTFRAGGDVVVSGSDDETNDRVIITIDSVIGLEVERASLALSGRTIGISGATSELSVTRSGVALTGREVVVTPP